MSYFGISKGVSMLTGVFERVICTAKVINSGILSLYVEKVSIKTAKAWSRVSLMQEVGLLNLYGASLF